MKKNVLVFGSIAGIIVSALMAMSLLYYHYNPDFKGGMIVGYASMLIAFSFIYVAIKNFRDKYNDGLISFGKAFKIGLYIALIGSTFYVVIWAFEFHFFMPDFMEKYSKQVVDDLIKSGATQTAIDAQVAEMGKYKEMYKNPLFFALFTYMEILPVGLLVTIISALILKKKNNNINQTQIA